MKTGHQVFRGFTTTHSYACNGCRRLLTQDRVHCLDCGADLCLSCAERVRLGNAVGRHRSGHLCVDYHTPVLVTGAEFIEERVKFRATLEASSGYFQQIVFPLLDAFDEDYMTAAIAEDESEPVAASEASTEYLKSLAKSLQFMLSRQRRGRFQDYFERRALAGTDIPKHVLAFSQGVVGCNSWKGLPLQKTVFECALYPMLLWDIKPKTIIEIGSGTGASAIWMADYMSMFELPAHIYSMDLRKSPLTDESVTFIEGDCTRIEDVFADDFLRPLPHPFLVIEDAHVNVLGVLRHLGKHLREDDYLVVEDSEPSKEEAVGKYVMENPGVYAVDTRYTDFFGYNATCATDSIFRRMK